MALRVTLSGPPGSGKTTLARLLSGRRGLPLVSSGELFRQMALEQGLTLAEFGRRAEREPRWDREVDRRMAREGRRLGRGVFEGRLAAHMVPGADVKLWLQASLEVRVARVARRDGTTVAVARRRLVERERSEVRRYRKYYKIDLGDLSRYHLVLDSGRWGPEELYRIVAGAMPPARRGR